MKGANRDVEEEEAGRAGRCSFASLLCVILSLHFNNAGKVSLVVEYIKRLA